MDSAQCNMVDVKQISPRNSCLNEVHRRRNSSLSIPTSEKSQLSTERDRDDIHTGNILEDVRRRTSRFLCIVVNTGMNLVSHWELPDWLQDNEYLHHFHRPQLDSFKKCFKSMFSIHSETGNIWTHFIGSLIITLCSLFIMIRPAVTSDGSPFYPKGAIEYLVFTSFFLGAQLCMTFSWLFHTLSCHSLNVKSYFAQLDYSGIALLITGSSIPVVYFGYYCRSLERYIYIGIILTFCVPVIGVSLWKKMSEPKYRPIRAALFLTFGLSNIVTVLHLGVLMGFQYMKDAVAVHYVILMGVLYISGTMLYVFRIPERFFPGRLNFAFISHQIFHILVVVAALVHLYAMCLMASYRAKIGRTCKL